jgi:hypothetical protein
MINSLTGSIQIAKNLLVSLESWTIHIKQKLSQYNLDDPFQTPPCKYGGAEKSGKLATNKSSLEGG